VRYIPNCELVVEEVDLAIIRYPFIAGNHLPASCKQVIGVLRHLMQIHNDGNIHMDMRASNLVFSENDGGSVIDFDFCSPVNDAIYPSNYCIDIGDGSRHKDVKAGGIGTVGHDCFSLASVFRLCTPDNGDFANDWDKVCLLVQNVTLQEALENICNSPEDYNLSSTAKITHGPATGSPPKSSLVADITVQMNQNSLLEETS
jgi:serine/threonine protein kinase